MEKLIAYKEFVNYNGAANEARSIAAKYGTAVSIARSQLGWIILIPPFLHSKIVIPKPSSFNNLSSDESRDDDYWVNDEQDSTSSKDDRDLIKELLDEQDSYARSEQDGWFYED